MAIIASTDIVTLSIVIGLIVFLDSFAYRMNRSGSGSIYIASMMLGVYTLGWVVKNASITYSYASNSGTQCFGACTTFFTTYSIDANLWAVIFAVLTLVTFLLLYFRIEGSA